MKNPTGLLGLIAAIGLGSTAMAQTGVNPGPDDVGKAPDIYSPYVARTVRNNNFADVVGTRVDPGLGHCGATQANGGYQAK